MRKFLLFLLVLMIVPWSLTRPRPIDPHSLPQAPANPGNGEAVFHAGGCASCHGEKLEGGHEMHTPFGTFRVPNISPHPESGIGGWSDLDLANAMLRGLSPDGQHYFPAFPYTSYTRMEPQDIVDLKAYLDTFSPVGNAVADHDIGFPWNLRRGIGLWKIRYLEDSWVVAEADSAEIEHGRYLVEALGHCGECHTPRDAFGGPDNSAWLSGGPNPDGEGKVPDITPREGGLADWSAADIAYYLESGFTPDYDTAGGSMVAVQENFARLTDDDRAAVAAYLKALPEVRK